MKCAEALIGPDTVTAVPPSIFEAFRDRERPAHQLSDAVEHAKVVLRAFAQTGASLSEITDRLMEEELRGLKKAFDELLIAVERHSNVDEPVQPNGLPGYSSRFVREREKAETCLSSKVAR